MMMRKNRESREIEVMCRYWELLYPTQIQKIVKSIPFEKESSLWLNTTVFVRIP